MKELSSYIIEKLDINNIKFNDKFPVEGPKEKIFEFLEDNGFEIEEIPKTSLSFKVIEELGKTKLRKAFSFANSHGFAIYFGDSTSNSISKDNPVYYIGKNYKKEVIFYRVFPSKYTTYATEEEKIDEKEFLKEVNKLFRF